MTQVVMADFRWGGTCPPWENGMYSWVVPVYKLSSLLPSLQNQSGLLILGLQLLSLGGGPQ